MKLLHASVDFRRLGLLLLLATSAQSAEVPSGFLADKSDFTSGHFFPVIQHAPNQWMLIEVSDDLREWTELVHIRSNREVFVYGDENASARKQRYYRLHDSAPTAEEARSRWSAQKPERYQFNLRLRRIALHDTLTGTVAVENGSKSVTNIEVNESDSNAQTSVGPDDFPDIDELFDLLAETESLSTLQTWVRYDDEFGYPIECQLDFRSARQEINRYLITNFKAF